LVDILKIILSFLTEALPSITSFVVGRKSKELDNVKKENKTLKKWFKIDKSTVSKDEVYDGKQW
jgi:hypothetical protein